MRTGYVLFNWNFYYFPNRYDYVVTCVVFAFRNSGYFKAISSKVLSEVLDGSVCTAATVLFNVSKIGLYFFYLRGMASYSFVSQLKL